MSMTMRSEQKLVTVLLVCLLFFAVGVVAQENILSDDITTYQFNSESGLIEYNIGDDLVPDWKEMKPGSSPGSFQICDDDSCPIYSVPEGFDYSMLLDLTGEGDSHTLSGLTESGVVDSVFTGEGVTEETKDAFLDTFFSLEDLKERNAVWNSEGFSEDAKKNFLHEWARKKGLSEVIDFQTTEGEWGFLEANTDRDVFIPKDQGGIDITALQEYMDATGGVSDAKKFTFDGGEYDGTSRTLEKITVGDGFTQYEFENNVQVRIEHKETGFDPNTGLLTVGDKDGGEKEYEWMNNKGHITIDSEGSIHLQVALGEEGDASNFPVLFDTDAGLHKSPYMVKTEDDVTFDGSKPASGAFVGFASGDKTYVVDSEGTIREVLESTIHADGIHRNVFVRADGVDEKDGRIFTSEHMRVITDGNINAEDYPLEEDVFMITRKGTQGEDKDQFMVVVRSNNGRAYYDQKDNVDIMMLEGDVSLASGNSIVASHKDGTVGFRRIDGSDGKKFLGHNIGILEFPKAKDFEDGKKFPRFTVTGGRGLFPAVEDGRESNVRIHEGLIVQELAGQQEQIGGTTTTPGGNTPPGSDGGTQNNQFILQSDTNYQKGVSGGQQWVQYNTVDHVRQQIQAQGSVQVHITEPSWCGPCRSQLGGGIGTQNSRYDPSKLYLTVEQAKELGYNIQSIPTTITMTGR